MIFDGERWTRSRSVIALNWSDPVVKEARVRYDIPVEYTVFARVLSMSKTIAMLEAGREPPKGYVRTRHVWPNTKDDVPVYAKVVEPEPNGWTLTSLMYGKDGYVYLMRDGRVYVRRQR
jgi:hypothetical protein